MLRHSTSISLPDPVFYVNEREGDEFTFYLHRDKDNTVIEQLRSRLGRPLKVGSGDGVATEMFSLPQRVHIKNLILTRDSLEISTRFWTRIRNAAPGTPHQYLCTRLKRKQQTRSCLKKRKLDEADRKLLTNAFLKILNQSVEKGRLENKKWLKKTLPKHELDFLASLQADEAQKWRNRLILEQAFKKTIKPTHAGRALICFSYVGRYLSVTFRKIKEDHGYKAGDYTDESKRKSNLFSLSEYCDLLYKEIFKSTGSAQHAHGLVVITGSTKSAKSEIARGLIQLYLDGQGTSERRHHLVTFEDPVERFYAYESVESRSPWLAVELRTKSTSRDYTPRQKETDTLKLQDALSDALRQTPALFFVGETRDPEEWKVLLDFAATGHLIVTTAHAGSLVEAMHKIFEALKVNTAADRSEVANKLLGVIHLRRHQVMFSGVSKSKQEGPGTLFPALWRRTPRGIAALTSDGLASLLPYRPKKSRSSNNNTNGMSLTGANTDHSSEEDRAASAASCLGRRWIIEQLISSTETTRQITKAFGEKLAKKLETQLYEQATDWDLDGV